LNIPINREYKRLLLVKKDTIAALDTLAKKVPYEKLAVKIEVIDKKTNHSFGKYISHHQGSKNDCCTKI